MNRVSQAIAFLHRLSEVMFVMMQWAGKIIHRQLSGRPIEGPQLVRQLCERLSGSFLKFGQILSLQLDSLPKEYCDALLSLLDSVPVAGPEKVDGVFLEEFGQRPTELYADFNYKAIASASIGQVHKARLFDGTEVAVKVQRPGIRVIFARDNILLDAMVRCVLFFHIRRLYFMRDAVRELSTWTLDELDYRREASYCELLGQNAIGNPAERIPRLFRELTTERVLTTEFLHGPSVARYLRMIENGEQEAIDQLIAEGFAGGTFSSNVISNFLSDAFRHGVFHADLHPANLLILPNNVVGYVDFGIVAVLTPEARHKQIQLTMAYASGDAEAIYRGFLAICIVSSDSDLPGLRRKIQELTRKWYNEAALGGKVRFKVSVTQTMSDLLSICQDYGVLVDREMIKYIRSTVLADGLVSRLAPEVDLARVLREVVEEYLEEEGKNKLFSAQAAMSALTDLALWMDFGPRGMMNMLSRLSAGELKIRARLRSTPDAQALVRTRAMVTAAVWIAVATAMGFGVIPLSRSAPYPLVITGVFMLVLSARLFRLLRRLA
ncbi:MAG: AarF/UbiB family protein [Bryobacteraceae bacterium]